MVNNNMPRDQVQEQAVIVLHAYYKQWYRIIIAYNTGTEWNILLPSFAERLRREERRRTSGVILTKADFFFSKPEPKINFGGANIQNN